MSWRVKCHLLGCSKALGTRGLKITQYHTLPWISDFVYLLIFSNTLSLMSWKGNDVPGQFALKLHQAILSRAQISQREASGLTWPGSGSSLAKTVFSFAVSAALRFWPVFFGWMWRVGREVCKEEICGLLFPNEKVLKGEGFFSSLYILKERNLLR